MRFEDQEPPRGCDDPTHGDECDCGADPDRAYEQALDI